MIKIRSLSWSTDKLYFPYQGNTPHMGADTGPAGQKNNSGHTLFNILRLKAKAGTGFKISPSRAYPTGEISTGPGSKWLPDDALAPQAQSFDNRSISTDVLAFNIIQQPSATTHQHQQPSSGMVIFFMNLQMVGQIGYPMCQQADLHLR
jgi:hypothetical protein